MARGIIVLQEETLDKIEVVLEWFATIHCGCPVPPWHEVEVIKKLAQESTREIHAQVHRADYTVGPGRRYERVSEEEGRRIGRLHIRARPRP